MKTGWLGVALFLALSGQAFRAQAAGNERDTRPTAEVEASLPASHPAAYYEYAMRLFGEDRKDDAVFWFYAGQLRYRFHLSANPDLAPDGDPAVMASLNESVGRVINEYAGGDPVTWAAQIERALTWDAQTENGFTSKAQHAAHWQEIRAGLSSLRDMIERDADSIRSQRAKAGLPNR